MKYSRKNIWMLVRNDESDALNTKQYTKYGCWLEKTNLMLSNPNNTLRMNGGGIFLVSNQCSCSNKLKMKGPIYAKG